MDKRSKLIQKLIETEKKYKMFREGTLYQQDEPIKSIKCPKSFKYDSYVEIDRNIE